MKANKFLIDSLKLAENLQREMDNAPNVLNNMMESMMPKLTNEEKVKMQSLVKESSKLMDDAKNGSISDIQQRIDELKNKYGSANNS
tara:strand:- start:583 stop:843 length:261 start_codon:yes stop_codon:yes gene_type:complete